MSAEPLLDDAEHGRLISEVTDLLGGLLVASGLTKAELARTLGRTRGYVTQVFSGKNLTLRTLNDFATAMGARVRITSESLDARRLPDNVIRFVHVPRDRRRTVGREQWVLGGSRIIRPVPLPDDVVEVSNHDSVAG
jgi:hypothetical protein